MTALASALQRYFSEYAHQQRNLSPNTIASYRDTWRLLIQYLAGTSHVAADRVDFDMVDAQHVGAFLDYLQHDRGNGAKTRNTRLTAIRAVLRHALPRHLEHADTISRVLAVPPKRHPAPILEFLTPAETDALLAAPDQDTWTGRRDHALFVLAIQTGLRVSELADLTLADIHLGTDPHVTCTGKGRRHRATPLTKTTRRVMTAYLAERRQRPGEALFPGPSGQPLSRDAFEHRLAQHLATATATGACVTLANKHITMHTLRHTTAMNLLAAGNDITVIAIWLGHQTTQSTDAYLHADMAIKQAAIDRTRPPNTRPGTYRPDLDILTWLNSL